MLKIEEHSTGLFMITSEVRLGLKTVGGIKFDRRIYLRGS